VALESKGMVRDAKIRERPPQRPNPLLLPFAKGVRGVRRQQPSGGIGDPDPGVHRGAGPGPCFVAKGKFHPLYLRDGLVGHQLVRTQPPPPSTLLSTPRPPLDFVPWFPPTKAGPPSPMDVECGPGSNFTIELTAGTRALPLPCTSLGQIPRMRSVNLGLFWHCASFFILSPLLLRSAKICDNFSGEQIALPHVVAPSPTSGWPSLFS